MNPKGLALLLFTSAVFAGTTSVIVHNTSVFRPDGGTTVTLHDKDGKTALEQCMDMAKAAPGKATCTDVYGITVTGTCDDVAKPVLPRELDSDGFVIKPPIRGKQITDTDWTTEIQDYVPAPYPTCWALGWREITQADMVEDQQLANDETPASKPPGFDAEYHTLAAELVRHETCVCYSDDLTACPEKCPG
jgi:hypothetical protein